MTKHNSLFNMTAAAIATGLMFSASVGAQMAGPVDTETSDAELLENIDKNAVFPVKRPFTELTIMVDDKVTLNVLPSQSGISVVQQKTDPNINERKVEAISKQIFDTDVAVVESEG
ncbi:hypothetical protein [Alteromonas oceanisediminis]|uniref:hypothetical protein n=1 Tax=Alteromonas oceanisediminis TaxID=2836180 RepID=UPI001BDA23A1|nr:hypothetical protein [Alteromonas oceanisediminis]MBT0586680.1 hypothetical protein [Alteromonas oceanisediminis]